MGEREPLPGWSLDTAASGSSARSCGVEVEAHLAQAAQFNWLRLVIRNVNAEYLQLGMEDTIADFQPGRRRRLEATSSETSRLLLSRGGARAEWLAFPHKRDFKYATELRVTVPVRMDSRVCAVVLGFRRPDDPRESTTSSGRYLTSDFRLGGGTGLASLGSLGHLGRAQQSVNLAVATYLMPRHGLMLDALLEAFDSFGHEPGRFARLFTVSAGYSYDWYLGSGLSTGYRAGLGATRLELLSGRLGSVSVWAPSVSERITLDYTWAPSPHVASGRYGLGLVLAHDFRAGGSRLEGWRLRGHGLSLLLGFILAGS